MNRCTRPLHTRICLPFAQGNLCFAWQHAVVERDQHPRLTGHPSRQLGWVAHTCPCCQQQKPSAPLHFELFPTLGLRWLFDLRHGAGRCDVKLISSLDVPTAPKCEHSPMSQAVPLLLPCMRQVEWELWLKEKSWPTYCSSLGMHSEIGPVWRMQ